MRYYLTFTALQHKTETICNTWALERLPTPAHHKSTSPSSTCTIWAFFRLVLSARNDNLWCRNSDRSTNLILDPKRRSLCNKWICSPAIGISSGDRPYSSTSLNPFSSSTRTISTFLHPALVAAADNLRYSDSGRSRVNLIVGSFCQAESWSWLVNYGLPIANCCTSSRDFLTRWWEPFPTE